jgi:hypothetical protein
MKELTNRDDVGIFHSGFRCGRNNAQDSDSQAFCEYNVEVSMRIYLQELFTVGLSASASF